MLHWVTYTVNITKITTNIVILTSCVLELLHMVGNISDSTRCIFDIYVNLQLRKNDLKYVNVDIIIC